MRQSKYLRTHLSIILITSSMIIADISAESPLTSTNDTNVLGTRKIGPWSEILEDWIVSATNPGTSRTSKVMKLGDKMLTVSTKGTPNKRDVSETDIYLLGAIEKLVYRVDYVEKRLRRAEELLYYVISGSTSIKDSCPTNYTSIGRYCYYFSDREYDWKSSASLCRGMGGHLVEFETIVENQDVISHIQGHAKLKGKHFWTGGLNPGLLWIWAGSARPIHNDTKQAVVGNGRCLKLSYDMASKIYSYKGEECASRQKFICELTTDDESANKIERTARILSDSIP
ncbi:C-type lectin domain family 9 member A [Polistes fuscatus]|uniref:C-type lectin domain family 9 member A n=1 Tax=Polistes fuscatus TaxID=30207 RepID=UPI001CA83A5D|nr:C-type lectin domain family 9 member A [Polistes fuscatus]